MTVACVFLIVCFCVAIPMACAETPTLELVMPASVYYPGTPCSIKIRVVNPGPALPRVQVFTALYAGSDLYWFYPQWNEYPPALSWKTMDLPTMSMTTLDIIPEFQWPEGLGSFCCITAFSAIMQNKKLVGGPVSFRFGWSDDPVQTLQVDDEPDNQPLPKRHMLGLVLAGIVVVTIGLSAWISAATAIDGQKSVFK